MLDTIFIMKSVAKILLVVCLALTACHDQKQVDKDLILEYAAENGLSLNLGDEGLYYVIDVAGTGVRPDVASTVTVDYEGFTLDGQIFDSSYDRGMAATFPLANLIRGWQIGIPLFREGGSGTLFLPSHLAYGSDPPPGSGIGPDEVLIFNIELHTVE